MKVIFIKDLKKQAKKGDIKEVKDGYAENYLIKNGYAIQVTEKNMVQVKKENDMKKQEEHFCSSCICIVTFTAVTYSVCN